MKIILKCLSMLLIVTLLYSNDLYAEDIKIGTTFSKIQCEYLDLDWRETFLEILKLDLGIIRLGAYWSEIEVQEGIFDFKDLDWQVNQAKKKGIPIILTVGMKAPRWPEYFIPDWIYKRINHSYSADISKDVLLQKYTLRFISEVIDHYQNETSIKFIQVENEALNRFGGKNWQLHFGFLKEEVSLVRDIDKLKRPIILTTATQPNKFIRFLVNIFTKGNPINDNLKICDILGINVYPIVGWKSFGINHYAKNKKEHREERYSYLFKLAKKKNKEIWITELQSEPWEPGILAHKKKGNPPSSSPAMTTQYFNELKDQGFDVFLFWGAEYWYYQKIKNANPAWWNMANEIMKLNRN